MRLFLYLVALLAGFSPAEASRASLASPVAVACVANSSGDNISVVKKAKHIVFADPVETWPRQTRMLGIRPALTFIAPLPIELSDRPRA